MLNKSSEQELHEFRLAIADNTASAELTRRVWFEGVVDYDVRAYDRFGHYIGGSCGMRNLADAQRDLYTFAQHISCPLIGDTA